MLAPVFAENCLEATTQLFVRAKVFLDWLKEADDDEGDEDESDE
jgi:hypothetical protein